MICRKKIVCFWLISASVLAVDTTAITVASLRQRI